MPVQLTDDEFCTIARALADPQRCEILRRAAAEGEVACSQLVEGVALCQSTVSHHLKELVAAQLLERRREGHFAYFRLRRDVMEAYLEALRARTLAPPPPRKLAESRARGG
ncbi:transcriptional regulator, ArsR family [Anaeromyxobacter sp. K]|uniref:Transcriptional regulator, ArsR family n=1 Tax=Anaeromyxobacter dehalogenans (strain ATCC BAA-258 / DSM 21875 / 2CP-1) TaxID=455488 RepID=B8JGY5_ANAD2|nr:MULTISPECIES: metalloregulator ArsR/SmtB family transcription factor [Anaeromyxobacter]ACG74415.1 transcriptional regulator, ArsR family [Anaeromyxobacter sp. K]ACL66622.1 transcriptional regulator, ArsR family [Anaeromyxobacter dehalogenans 2CP-1]